jgi:hypothetical protein
LDASCKRNVCVLTIVACFGSTINKKSWPYPTHSEDVDSAAGPLYVLILSQQGSIHVHSRPGNHGHGGERVGQFKSNEPTYPLFVAVTCSGVLLAIIYRATSCDVERRCNALVDLYNIIAFISGVKLFDISFWA